MTIRQYAVRDDRPLWHFDIEGTLSRLTLREKIVLLSGVNHFQTAPIARLGIPSLKMCDGADSVTGTAFTPTASIPCGIALASSFDRELVEQCGGLQGDESRAKGVHCLLGPTVNMARNPLAGRGFEYLSEDPVLAGTMAAAYCKGVRSKGVVSVLKHLICYDSEQKPWSIEVTITQRALRELYLKPFMLAVKAGNVPAIMTAYGRVNGKHGAENDFLMDRVVRQEWGYKGLFVSDWFGTCSTKEAVEAGLDLEMPGPSKFRGEALIRAVLLNTVQPSTIDDRVRAMLMMINEAAKAGIPENSIERPLDRPKDRLLMRKAAANSVVLLKNDGEILPLDRKKTIAVIGPNANVAQFRGGKTEHANVYYACSPLEGIKIQSLDKVTFAQGCYNYRDLPHIGSLLRTEDGDVGFTARFYDLPPGDHNRKLIETEKVQILDGFFKNTKYNNIDYWYVDTYGTLTVDETQIWDLAMSCQGTARLFIDEELIIDNLHDQEPGLMFFHSGTTVRRRSLKLQKGRTYEVRILFGSPMTSTLEQTQTIPFRPGGIYLGGLPRIDHKKLTADAVEVAREADQVLLCIGLTGDWEQERLDRDRLELPEGTDTLVEAILEVKPDAVICIQSGSPVTMPWIHKAKSVLQAWYGGCECGSGIADVVFGQANPSAKLPITFPISLKDTPTYFNYKPARNSVIYGEDVFMGYRYYDMVEKKVLFPFGHGLSYTTFVISEASAEVDEHKGSLQVSCSVENTGSYDGAEIIQVYLSQQEPSIMRPAKELKGYEKVFVKKGQKEQAVCTMELKYALSYWDEMQNSWICEKGIYNVLIGNSSKGKFEVVRIELKETFYWQGL